MSSKLQLDGRHHKSVVAPSGERLRTELDRYRSHFKAISGRSAVRQYVKRAWFN